ncbi:14769_t:CDS:2 [Acaulospora morrowiae]|uniref:Cytochrome c oxidase subunit 8, mitochondrial n=1 Tax=Acaulospora morrowiae TaxID=94023 RepID=A0A9N9EF48_9GLOM|nr:14769_t:CDS:2 [Acaulospora morrowiae]
MYSSVFSRSALRARAVIRPTRSDVYHWENVDGSHLPFSTKSRVGLAIKMTMFLGLGFAVPVIGAWWQFHKAGKPFYRPGPPPS